MDSKMKKERVMTILKTPCNTSHGTSHSHTSQCCFFCIMAEADTSLKRAEIDKFFKQMLLRDDEDEHVLVLSGLWHIAMSQPNDPQFPSLGIFNLMAKIINKGINDRNWLVKNQNIYIPYYAAHIIGSYTMNKEEFAQMAVQSGAVAPLMELLRGKISWVEQRVAVRALGHLVSYDSTFKAIAEYEQELVKLAMNLASTCLHVVYVEFVGVKDENKRLEYHRKLLSRGIGGLETENRKAEEWASQLQCWSLHLLNCFACKQRSLDIVTNMAFLEDLCDMWGGLVNHTSPGGVGLIRILCYSKMGRKRIVESPKVIKFLGNLSRSSDYWQYLGINCLLLLLKDPYTRYRVIDVAASHLIDLIELRNLGDKPNVGETIMKVLNLEVKRRNKEKTRVLVSSMKQKANQMMWLGEVEGAIRKYSEALEVCPLRYRRERMVLFSNRAVCYLLIKDPDSAISDSTRALCLSNPANTHSKSLWRRSQAYDMKGMARESLMDCLMLISNGCIRIPYHVARMLCKQMEATWVFATARSNLIQNNLVVTKGRSVVPELSTIIEEPLLGEDGRKKKAKGGRWRVRNESDVMR